MNIKWRIAGTLNRFSHWANTHQNLSFFIMGALIVAGAALIAIAALYQPTTKAAVAQAAPKRAAAPAVAQKYYSPLTGAEVDQATTKRAVTAIMIENSAFARPQSGLKPAGVIFEAIAEAGITRFLTLHQEDRPQLIGPVRSLRPYYIDWLAPFDPSVAHVGGSANALGTIRNGQFKDIDQFFNSNYYWRATDRAAPHNVYTSFDKIDALNQSKGYTTSNVQAWPRKIDTPLSTPTATTIDIVISSSDYNVHYAYDKPSNSYLRSEGGAQHKDREAGQLSPKVVIALKVPTQTGFEDGYREQMTTLGSGQAFIFQDGGVYDITWHKADQKSQIQFYDKLGHVIAFNAGQTWVSVTAPDQKVAWQ